MLPTLPPGYSAKLPVVIDRLRAEADTHNCDHALLAKHAVEAIPDGLTIQDAEVLLAYLFKTVQSEGWRLGHEQGLRQGAGMDVAQVLGGEYEVRRQRAHLKDDVKRLTAEVETLRASVGRDEVLIRIRPSETAGRVRVSAVDPYSIDSGSLVGDMLGFLMDHARAKQAHDMDSAAAGGAIDLERSPV